MTIVPVWHGQVSVDGKAVTLFAFTDDGKFVNGFPTPSYGGYVYQSELRWGRGGPFVVGALGLTMEESVLIKNKLNDVILGEEKTGTGGTVYRAYAQGLIVSHCTTYASVNPLAA